jgi:hypothetical protein
MDKQNFRKRVLMRLLSSPMTLLPTVGGATLLMGAWAMGRTTGMILFAGVVAVLGGVGTFLSRLLMGGGRVADDVARRIEQEAETEREQALDGLGERLATDGDPRTEAALNDLRVLANSVQGRKDWGNVNARSAFDLSYGVDELFSTCVRYLEKTLELKETADRVTTPSVRQAILQEREQLVADVQKSTEHIGELLGKMERFAVSGGTHTDLARVREELDANLELARQVEERMATWDEQHVRAG